MNPIIRNIVAVVAGFFICMFVNGGIISISSKIIPPPEGMNVNDMESIKAMAHLFEPKHYAIPFLAHALGSIIGALVASLIAASRKITFAIVIGSVHLIGGIAAAFMIPAPVWFIALDLVAAYIPASFLGGLIAVKLTSK